MKNGLKERKRKLNLNKPMALVLTISVLVLFLPAYSLGSKGADLGPDSYDVVVIGAGGGGVSAAARLALDGMKVLVIEQHDRVGGYMSSFERGDFRFEVSLHAMDGMGTEVFPKLGIENKVKKVKLDPAYRSVFPDFIFDVPADVNEYRKKLKEQFPHEAKGIDELFDDLDLIYQGMQVLMCFQDGVNIGSAIGKAVTKPWMFWPIIKYWDKNTTDMLGDYIQDEKLFALFVQLMAYTGVDADSVSGMFFAMMWISYHHSGFYYFEGGSQAVTKACAEVVEENNGKILLSTRATKIVMKDGKAVAVQTKDGKEFKCRYVVSNANVPDTYNKLIGRQHFPEDYLKKVDAMTIGLPGFGVYMGTNREFNDVLPEGIHSLFFNPCYDQQEIFKYYREGIIEKSMFGLINYTMVDPTNAPKGKSVIAAVSIMPYDYKGDWYESQGEAKYKALKEEVAQTLIARAEKFFPGLSESIEVMEVGTPRTMERYTSNPGGTIFGWEFIKEQSMLKRLEQQTPIDNVILSGAWTFPGGGQSAVLMSGIGAAKIIMDKK